MNLPNKDGFYGEFGGCYVSPELETVMAELKASFDEIKNDANFLNEYKGYLKDYVSRPSPLYFAQRLTEKIGGAKIYLKREDLNHTGAHKINNAIGQALLAKKLGKNRIIAETGAGSHGVAVATACALFDMECIIYMGAEDIRRQSNNVFKIELLGAKVVPVTAGQQTLKDAVDAALDDLAKNYKNTFYMLGSAVGPDPYPEIVAFFQSVIGQEIKSQCGEIENKLPDAIVACVGGGSNSIGAFKPFFDEKSVKLYGAEPGGLGTDTKDHAATMTKGVVGVIHGFKTLVLQDENGEILPVYSIAAGLDYPGVGPEHSYYKSIGRADYRAVTDKQAIDSFLLLSKTEGIIPAIESSHAISLGCEIAKDMSKDESVVIVLSGRGDKDVEEMARILKK